MDKIVKNNKDNIPKLGKQRTKQSYKSLESVLSSKHEKANDFIKRVKLSF